MTERPLTAPAGPGGEAAGRFLTVANLLSIARILLIVPFTLVMFSADPRARLWAVAIMALAAATDKFDGIVARHWGQTTRWGHILDPLADKIAAGGVIVVLLLLGAIPIWFVVLALGRDAAILLAGVWLRLRKGILLPPNRTGKWAVGITALALALLVLGTGGVVTDLVLAAASVLLVTSSVLYAARFIRVVRGAKPPEALVS